MTDINLIGKGQPTLGGKFIENAAEVNINPEIKTIEIKNNGTPQGGIYATNSEIEKVTVTIKLFDFSAELLAIALSGEAFAVASASVIDEALIAKNAVAPTSKMIDISQTVTVTHNAGTRADSTAYAVGDWIFDGTHLYQATVAGTSAGTPPTFQTDGTDTVDGAVTWADKGVFSAVKDVDFVASAAGIRSIVGGGIPVNAPIKVSYTSYASGKIEVGSLVAEPMPFIFDGYNKATNEPMRAEFYRVDFTSDAGVPLITEEYGDLTLTGTVLLDSSKPLSASQFGYVESGGLAVL